MSRSVVFVHGNPETSAIWSPLCEALGDRGVESRTVSPPGFGAPLPDGFDPTMDAYASWLVGELERLAADGMELDVVGHDWGAGHVAGALVRRPDLFRTWAVDIAGALHADYVWHDMAQVWQTAEVGEQAVTGMAASSLDDKTALFVSLGLPEAMAREVAGGVDETMGRCVLRLYRSAVQPAMGELGARLAASDHPPGLVVNAALDAYVPSELTVAMADAFGAEIVTLADRGHWWMVDDVDGIADSLCAFWAAH